LANQLDQPIVPSESNPVADQADVTMETTTRTLTSDNVITKRPRRNINMEDSVPEASAPGSSSKTTTVSTRVTRQSKRLQVNTDPIGGPAIDQTDFVMKLFEIKSAFNGKHSRIFTH
jgi:hypothetical protein